ncbi:hypothetical protein LF844_17085 [Metapseudomonas lalkuanensis]|uniref:hypothetical protein n=1 Tax=Metapseudomonas lalkuanensis TaxID=2604832 RepID=UPI001CF4CE53|nr:hypothetical protein [Pseudomonas lalkuanensis]UCO96388.1 hypothetical protein LF844_17085 [Pseudomonas lalkuanensis]
MSPEIEARYLAIEWQSEGVARAIDVSPVALELEPRTEGGFAVESTIFNDFHPWLGIRLEPWGEEVVPVFVTVLGRETPMLRVADPRGGGFWWLQNDGWDHSGKRHFSELQRSPGTYNIRIGDVVLQIENRLSAFGRTDIQAYVDDFRGDLLWMIMNDAANATATGNGVGTGAELADTLEELHAASKRVLASPAVNIREGQAPQPVAKVRPNATSFREYVRNPVARQLTGRVFDESADTAENRYLRHMLAVCLKVADAYVSAATLQSDFLDRLASQEKARAKRNREMEMRPVDPEVFDQQSEEIEQKLDLLATFKDPLGSTLGRPGQFPIYIRKTYYENFSFYYTPQEGCESKADDDLDYRVVVLPEGLFKLILGSLHFCRNFTIEGSVESRVVKTKYGKQFLRLTFTSVDGVVPQTDELKKRTEKRRGLEKSNWFVRLSGNERRELEREANSAERRAERSLGRKLSLSYSLDRVRRGLRRLAEIDAGFDLLGVSLNSSFPTGMRFVSNPDYATCLSAFKKLRELIERGGLDLSKLDEINSVGILHASDIYEKWCLLKIFMLLVHDFRLEPEPGWEEKLVATSLSRASNVRFEFLRDDLEMKVALTCQSEMLTGRRPDFVLEVIDIAKKQFAHLDHESRRLGGLVMDAKFRSTWKKGELRQTLDELVLAKGYDKAVASRRVFILQPCESTARPASSPLDWGVHCDYGSTQSHRQGWIQLGVASTETHTTQHLKRLLTMVFQNAFPEPEEPDENGNCTWTSRSFCLGCGECHAPEAIQAKTTKSGATRWLLDCKRCGVWTVRTHCYNCKTPLFKNGTMWTYHNTVADQVTNVICPGCGSYFDAGFS